MAAANRQVVLRSSKRLLIAAAPSFTRTFSAQLQEDKPQRRRTRRSLDPIVVVSSYPLFHASIYLGLIPIAVFAF